MAKKIRTNRMKILIENFISQQCKTYINHLLIRYKDTVLTVIQRFHPRVFALYLRELANNFDNYYNAHKTLTEEKDLGYLCLSFIFAVKQVLANGLKLLGIKNLNQCNG